MAVKRDYYEILSVTRTADGETIKKSYRKLAMQYHPDRNHGDEEASAMFKEATEAYEVLADDTKRQLYDQYGHDGLQAHAQGGGGFGRDVNLDDLLGGLFGDFFGGQQGGQRRQAGPQRGRDIQVILDLELLEAATGVKKSVTLQRQDICEPCHGSGAKPGTSPKICSRCKGQGVVIQRQGFFQVQQTCRSCSGQGKVIADPCPTCRGNGTTSQRKTLDVDVPAGVDTGQRIRYEGHGDAGSPGGPRGDLEFAIRVKEHRFFQRDGSNLICQWPITFSQAALGAKLEITTLTGEKVQHDLPSGTQTHEVIRLKKHGMPTLRGAKGDLLMQVIVDTPHKLTKDQRELFEQLAKSEGSQVNQPHKKSIFSRLKDWLSVENE